ncbi:hypothetical protein ACFXTI_005686 [Malus domestica]
MRRSSGEGNSTHGLSDPRRVLRRQRRVSATLVFSERPHDRRIGSLLLLHFFFFRFAIPTAVQVIIAPDVVV